MLRRDFLTLAALAALSPYAAASPEDGILRAKRRRRRRGRRRGRNPNIVCVLVDQLRKDSFDAWCPATRKLAAGGVVFEAMRAAAPWTYPSTISLMSGLYPQQHGADGVGVTTSVARFSDRLPLLHRLLKARDYRTAAFVTNPFLKEWNSFHVGFDAFYSDYVKNTGARRPAFGDFGVPSRMFSDSVNADIVKHFAGSKPKRPEFTYIHYIDVHGPWKGAPFHPTYESSARYIDRRIVEIHEMFQERYDGDVLFFVTSDHGRHLDDDMTVGYGSKWRIEKASVHDFNIRIPFVVLPGRRIQTPVTVTDPCSNVDFVPTILELAGLDPPLEYPGLSLAGPLGGASRAGDRSDRAIYARHAAWGTACDGLVFRGRKYVRHIDPESGRVLHRRVFDLATDPRETESITADFGRVEKKIEQIASLRAFESAGHELPEDVEDQLRSLGYLGGSC